MRYKVFWYAATLLISVASYLEWARSWHNLIIPALVGSVIISFVWEWIWIWREDVKAKERERLTLLCKHGNPRLKSCKSCAEEFAYWDTCKLCGYNWDTRREKHDHTLHVENFSGSRMQQHPLVMSHYSSHMSMMPTMSLVHQSSYLSASYPMSSLGHGAECKLTR